MTDLESKTAEAYRYQLLYRQAQKCASAMCQKNEPGMTKRKLMGMTTDNPESNDEAMLNYAFVQDLLVKLRYACGRENADLAETVSHYCPEHVNAASILRGACMDCDYRYCPGALINVLGIQAAELRERLKEYEQAESAGQLIRFPATTGHWVGTEYDGFADGNPVYETWECSECGEEHYGDYDTLTRFCPHCGAAMSKDVEQNDET